MSLKLLSQVVTVDLDPVSNGHLDQQCCRTAGSVERLGHASPTSVQHVTSCCNTQCGMPRGVSGWYTRCGQPRGKDGPHEGDSWVNIPSTGQVSTKHTTRIQYRPHTPTYAHDTHSTYSWKAYATHITVSTRSQTSPQSLPSTQQCVTTGQAVLTCCAVHGLSNRHATGLEHTNTLLLLLGTLSAQFVECTAQHSTAQ